jgi:diguanylate cyclase (GGDEF)-like protein/PAS domain S-box-containing protein
MKATSTEFYKGLLDHLTDGVYFVDSNRKILFWNDSAFRLTGYLPAEVIGRCCQDNLLQHVDDAGHQLCCDGCPLTDCIGDGQAHDALVHLRHKDGHRVPVSVRVRPMRDEDGAVIGAIEIFSDDTAHAQARMKAEEMQRLAYLDSVTQLPNRRFVEMALDSALDDFTRNGKSFGVLMLDLDKLKLINDTFGHCGGDRALLQAARSLAASLRPSDVVGRWGGDEFVAVVRGVSRRALGILARRSAHSVARVAVDDGQGGSFPVRISVGAAFAKTGDTAQNLVCRADQRMYRCKTQSRAAAD